MVLDEPEVDDGCENEYLDDNDENEGRLILADST